MSETSLPDYTAGQIGLWVCYCGTVAPFDPYVFPHRDCDGGRPLTPEEIAAREGS